MVQAVKNPPAMQETQETQVGSLGGDDPLEEEMTTHSSILAWEIPWSEKPGGLQATGSQRSDTTEWLSTAQHDVGHEPLSSSTQHIYFSLLFLMRQ